MKDLRICNRMPQSRPISDYLSNLKSHVLLFYKNISNSSNNCSSSVRKFLRQAPRSGQSLT